MQKYNSNINYLALLMRRYMKHCNVSCLKFDNITIIDIYSFPMVINFIATHLQNKHLFRKIQAIVLKKLDGANAIETHPIKDINSMVSFCEYYHLKMATFKCVKDTFFNEKFNILVFSAKTFLMFRREVPSNEDIRLYVSEEEFKKILISIYNEINLLIFECIKQKERLL